MKKGFIEIVVLFLLLFILSGMAYRHDKDPELYYKLGRESRFDCVVMISNMEIEDERGSGVLINERFVLTAAHVLLIEETKDTTIIQGPFRYETYIVTGQHLDSNVSNYVVRINGKDVEVKNVVIHPDYSLKKDRCDIALVELSEPVEGIEFPVLNEDIEELGEVVFMAGYGAVCRGDKYNKYIIDDRKMAGMNRIDSVGGYVYDGSYAELFCDFDHPGKSKYNVLGNAEALELECSAIAGDSGSGMFIDKDGRLILTGVLIGEGNTGEIVINKVYGTVNRYNRVMAFYDWVIDISTKN